MGHHRWIDVWSALVAAVAGALASLAGVTLGALVEPWRLGAAERVRVRRERADRCAGLIEAATTARQHLVDLNVLYRRRSLAPDSPETSLEREIEYEDLYYASRTSLRRYLSLLVMSGPDELVALARRVREADGSLHDRRFDLDPDGSFDRTALPPTVRESAKALDRAIEEFAEAANRLT
jgi:hypothetical protein